MAGQDDGDWSRKVKGERAKSGTFIIEPGVYGIEGRVIKELPLGASEAQIKECLLDALKTYSRTEDRKDYNTHLKNGKRAGIEFENEMAQGVDRDEDGKLDKKGANKPKPGEERKKGQKGRGGKGGRGANRR